MKPGQCQQYWLYWDAVWGRPVQPGQRFCHEHSPETRREWRRELRHAEILRQRPVCQRCKSAINLKAWTNFGKTRSWRVRAVKTG
jgi:transposase-like protein